METVQTWTQEHALTADSNPFSLAKASVIGYEAGAGPYGAAPFVGPIALLGGGFQTRARGG
eukprot:948712-Pleurochrysis_carterae.AAC.3